MGSKHGTETRNFHTSLVDERSGLPDLGECVDSFFTQVSTVGPPRRMLLNSLSSIQTRATHSVLSSCWLASTFNVSDNFLAIICFCFLREVEVCKSPPPAPLLGQKLCVFLVLGML